MRILQVHNLYREPGGEQNAADLDAHGLRAAGDEVEIRRIANPSGALASAGTLALAPWNPRSERWMRRTIAASRPEVAHVHNTWFALSPSILGALSSAGVPTVATLHNYRLICVGGQLFHNGKVRTDCIGHPWRGAAHRCYRNSFAQSAVLAATTSLNRARGTWDAVSRFVVPSNFMRETFIEAGFDPAALVVKANAVVDPGPRPTPPSQSKTLLYVGRLSDEKGVEMLVRAFSRASSGAHELELVVVGDGPLREELSRLAPARVRMVGWRPREQVSSMMLEARALLLPSRWPEPFGLVIAEAFAAGLPVLAADVGAATEAVGALGARWLAPADDESAWSSALIALGDDSSIDQAGLRARELFEREYSLDVSTAKLRAVYSALLT